MIRALMGSKRLTETVEKITESGIWIVPARCKSVEVWAIGGGGGGGWSSHGGGGGGGGGQIVHQIITVTPGQQIQVTIGQGGQQGRCTGQYVGANGGKGGSTVFGNITALGGDGGGAAYSTYSQRGGDGGVNYCKGGDGGSTNKFPYRYNTPGSEGLIIEGEVYGSGGGSGGVSANPANDGPNTLGLPGGTNAGHGFSLNWMNDDGVYVAGRSNAKAGYGGGGGADCTPATDIYISGGSGAVILKYQKQK